MAELSDDHKREIVELLACFHEVATIRDYFREQHDLDLDHKQIGSYDPTRSYFEASQRWKDLFEQQRAAYIAEIGSIPIANQAYRLNVLQRELNKAVKRNDPTDTLAILEQAAKEVGGILTNQRELRVDDSRRLTAREMTPEDRRAAMSEIIRQALEQRREAGLALPAPVEQPL